jgi:hypothetical protein
VALIAAVLFPAAFFIAAFGGALLIVRFLSRRDGFGFADGFLRFDGRDRWPRGVQEDDDFRWHWRA